MWVCVNKDNSLEVCKTHTFKCCPFFFWMFSDSKAVSNEGLVLIFKCHKKTSMSPKITYWTLVPSQQHVGVLELYVWHIKATHIRRKNLNVLECSATWGVKAETLMWVQERPREREIVPNKGKKNRLCLLIWNVVSSTHKHSEKNVPMNALNKKIWSTHDLLEDALENSVGRHCMVTR